ncbi:MAG: metallophosphoesterase, partial [Cyanobacteria bacterium J06606_4]
LGNHDYYDLSMAGGLLSKALSPLRRLLRKRINLDVGWHGSYQGEGFAKAFLDCLEAVGSAQLSAHIKRHYPPKANIGRCLRYEPGVFTRLPNRYYTFRRGGIDFLRWIATHLTHRSPYPKQKRAASKGKK